MPYEFTQQGLAMQEEVKQFMADHIYPNEVEYFEQMEEVGQHGYPPILDKLKAAAKERGLWNLFLPHLAPDAPGTKLSNLDYAPISEQLGKVIFASETLNCAAPDTGNMEILNMYGSETVKREWLAPLLEGEIRSAFSMTEPDAASSDATNIGLRMERKGDHYLLNGTKWFSSGAFSDRCEVLVVMGKTDPTASRHRQQSMMVVPKARGWHLVRPHPARVRLRRARRPSRDPLRERQGPASTTCWARRGAASPSPRPASARAGSTTACARSAWRSGPSST